ncbi:MAG TPA: branched-chain amino acid ABC transporter permease [Dermatophilaceae bacterium]|nr:branched-chain amino acid ABC transporter permease [Dermatophilaceae bacterium]
MATTTVQAAEGRKALAIRQALGRGLGWLILGLAGLWLVVNLIEAPTRVITLIFNGLNNGSLFALIALGYTLVYGIIELINFAHGDLFMLGTVFASWFMVTLLGLTTVGAGGWLGLVVGLFATAAVCAGLNVGAERLAYRRLRRAPKLAALITAVGVSFIFQAMGIFFNGSAPRQWPKVIPAGGVEIGGVTLTYNTIVVLAITIPSLLILNRIVAKTRQGKAMRATAQDQDAARLMGINVDRTIAFTFALGGAMAGIAGLLWMETVGTTRYDLGFQLGLIAFTAAVLGGIGNLNGAVLGGLLIGLVQSLNDGAPYGLGQKWSQTTVFTILILVMVFKPEGLLGKPTIEKV